MIVVDTGHTRTKLHVYRGASVRRWSLSQRPFEFPDDLDPSSLDEEVLLMGTHEHQRVRLRSHLSQRGWKELRTLGVDLRVPIEGNISPRTGNDRLAQALGAVQLHPGRSALVVGVGSAVVVDRVDASGRFLGGSIGIGRGAYLEAMRGINGVLDGAEDGGVYPAGDTPEAVELGWREPLCQWLMQLAQGVEVALITGGDAERLLPLLKGFQLEANLGADAMARALGAQLSF